jgi:uncharacterized protein CbrC (UPF0167 family)
MTTTVRIQDSVVVPDSLGFRAWCQEMWYQHVDEMISLTNQAPNYHAVEYFARYKHWLRREYRYWRTHSIQKDH